MKKVYVVHVVDAEGPLQEDLLANFERVKEEFGYSVNPTHENLKKLQNKEIDLNGLEEVVSRMLSLSRISYNETWDQIDRMLDTITSNKFRKTLEDCDKNGWVYNWLCMDHVGIDGVNPRRRDLGFHNIFDHYVNYLSEKNSTDLIQWHYHSLSITNDAHRCGSAYLNSNHIHSILSRRIIDRSWFPSVFRAGHNTQRPDSNFFLEQWIPFDYSNTSTPDMADHKDISSARYGDWRHAPSDWTPYHPSHDNYQVKGGCRRFIARCLPIDDRGYSISHRDVFQAFEDASKNGSSILSITNHDFRDMETDVLKMMDLLKKVSSNFPDVDFKYSNAIEAMRKVCSISKVSEIGISVELEKYKNHTRLNVWVKNKIFGPQPYLAIKTLGGDYYWQNFDFEKDNQWSYSFDSGNLMIDAVAEIGIAANTICGLTEVVNVIPDTGKIINTILNR